MSRRPSSRPGTPPSSSGSKGVMLLVGGIVLVSVLALVAVIATSGSDDGGEIAGLEQQRETQPSGSFLPVFGDGEDTAIGMVAPTVAGRSFDGTALSVGNGQGPQLLTFLAHWCPHCQAEVPDLVDLMAGGSSIDGVPVVAIATSTDDTAPNYPPSSWLDGEGWTAPALADDKGNHAAEAFGLSGFPFFVALDANGTVVGRASGELSADQVRELAAKANGA